MKNQVTVVVLCWLLVISGRIFAQDVVVPNVRDSIRDSFPGSYDGLTSTFDPSDVPVLLEMLESENDEEYWPRVLIALGLVGDGAVVDVLIEVIERPIIGPVYISRTQDDTRLEAIRALGVLAGRTDNEQALNYLIESLDDSIWRRRNIQGVPSSFDSFDRYDRRLSIHAIFGLALSGHPRAGDALRSLQQSPTPEQARLRNGLDDVLDSWLEVHDLVAERGLGGMYEYYAERQLEAEREAQ